MILNGEVTAGPINWSRCIPQTNLGDLKMVTEWWRLAFVVNNLSLPDDQKYVANPDQRKYIGVAQTD